MLQNKFNFNQSLVLFAIFIYALFSYGYLIARYRSNFAEVDTAVLTEAIHATWDSESISNADEGSKYSNGMAYPAIATFAVEVTGLDISTLQTQVFPLIAAGLMFALFVLYYTLTGNKIIASLATLFAYLQPDFLWVTWRGSHEKFTWLFALIMLFALSKSFSYFEEINMLSKLMFVFYLCAFALISSNTFFASTVIFALMASFAGAYMLNQLSLSSLRNLKSLADERHMRRLLYIALSCIIFFYLFVFHLYDPSLATLRAANNIAEQVSVVILDVEQQTNPYGIVRETWISTNVWLILSSFNWFILLISAITWIYAVRWMIRERGQASDVEADENLQEQKVKTTSRVFLWLVYPAFVMQLLVTVISDRAGAFVGNNLQVRVFTPVLLTAIPVAAIGIFYMVQRFRWLRPVLVASIAVFFVFSVYKASNEPLVSNNWVFYTDNEIIASDWMRDTTPEGSLIWTGLNNRLEIAIDLRGLDEETELLTDSFTPEDFTKYFIFSELEQSRWLRIGNELLPLDQQNQVYSNGDVQVYHRRPQNRFQK